MEVIVEVGVEARFAGGGCAGRAGVCRRKEIEQPARFDHCIEVINIPSCDGLGSSFPTFR